MNTDQFLALRVNGSVLLQPVQETELDVFDLIPCDALFQFQL